MRARRHRPWITRGIFHSIRCDGEWSKWLRGRLLWALFMLTNMCIALCIPLNAYVYSTNDFKLRFTLHFRAMCADLRGLFFYAYKQFASLLWLWMIFICVLHAIKRMLMNFFASSFFFFSSFFRLFALHLARVCAFFEALARARSRAFVCVCVCKT